MTVGAVAAAGPQGSPLGFQQFTPVAAANLPSIPAAATYAVIMCTAAMTWRDDGTAPTAAIGMVWPANTPLYYAGTLAKLQIISATGNVNVSYYG